MTTLTAVLTNGIVAGAIYGLIAVGLALVYKKSGVLHFANAEVGMLGAFLFYVLLVEQGWSYVAAAVVGVVTSGMLGGLTYLVLAPRRDDPLMMLIGTLGVAGVIVFAALEIWGADPYFVPPPLSNVAVEALGFRLVGSRMLVLVAVAILGLISFVVFRKTQAGLLFRASAADPYAAQLMGVNVARIDVLTWALAGALAGLAAILIAPLVGFHVFFMTLLAVRGFAAALLGGMGNVGAGLLWGLAVGVSESTLTYATVQRGLPEAMLVVLIVAVLVFRPVPLGRRTA